jgi:hypothetical protein
VVVMESGKGVPEGEGSSLGSTLGKTRDSRTGESMDSMQSDVGS